MGDTLEIFGNEYENVAGFKVKDSNGNTLTYTRGGGGGGQPSLQAKSVSYTPTTSAQSETVTADSGYDGLSAVTVAVAAIPAQYIVPTGSTTISANGTGIDVAQYATVNVSVPSEIPETQTKIVSPTESQQTVEPDSGKYLSSVIVNAISSTYVGTAIDRNDSTDLTVSGATVNVPAGYYASAASKAVASGTATTPTTTITANPAISVSASGLITATTSASQSITPNVSAGYVSSGTAGTVTVDGSNTQQLTTQAAATITPTKVSQTAVASGVYTIGAVTVAAIPAAYQDVTGVTATASDVISGKDIVDSTGAVLHGSLVIQYYYTGSSAPSSSLGDDGDIYLMTS